MPKSDLKLIRKAREDASRKIIASMNFDELEIRDFTVSNNQDNFQIPVKLITHKKVAPDSPITIFFHGGGKFSEIICLTCV